MGIRIITDSTCDLPADLQSFLGIDIVPLKVRFDKEEFLDGVDITKEEFYKKLSVSPRLPTTSQVNPESFLSLFKTYREAGDEIIGIFISSDLSGTFQSAVIAKRLMEDPPQIHLIDSRNVTMGLALLVYEAIRLRDLGQSAEAITATLEELKKRVSLYAVFDTLKYLKMGGRLSTTAAVVGGLLNVKPVITVRQGLIVNDGKARGSRAAYHLIADRIKSTPMDEDYDVIFAHAHAPEAVNEFKKILAEDGLFPDQSRLARCKVLEIGSVVGTHTGPGALGITWVKKENH
jgi:DegV family protein with EDD domain